MDRLQSAAATMQASSMKISPLDLMTAIIKGKSQEGGVVAEPALAMIAENRELLMLLTTSVAVLVGCVLVLMWRRSSSGGQKAGKAAEPPKPLAVKVEPEDEADDGKKKVAIFFGTQTGTAEGFAKVGFPPPVLTGIAFLFPGVIEFSTICPRGIPLTDCFPI